MLIQDVKNVTLSSGKTVVQVIYSFHIPSFYLFCIKVKFNDMHVGH